MFKKTKTIICLGIPRTGSASFQKALRMNFNSSQVVVLRQNNFSSTMVKLLSLKENDLKNIRLICGHIPHYLGALFENKFLRHEVYYISFFRSPLERAISQYSQLITHHRAIRDEDGHIFFGTRRLDDSLEDLQVKWLNNLMFGEAIDIMNKNTDSNEILSNSKENALDIALQKAINFIETKENFLIGILEDYENSCSKIGDKLGLVIKPSSGKLHVRKKDLKIESEIIERLKRLNRRDEILYNHALEKYHARN